MSRVTDPDPSSTATTDDARAAISHKAIGANLSPKEAALCSGVSEELFDRVVVPLNLTRPGSADQS